MISFGWKLFNCSLPALLLSLFLLLPFLDKAFTIDDTLFLLQAKHLAEDPLHPSACMVVWSELPIPVRMSHIMPNGPVMAWLLFPCVAAGGHEWIAHAIQLLMLAIAIVATVSLGLRIGLSEKQAMLSGLLLSSMPVVLGMAATAMPDIPAMALGIAGLERFLAWKKDRCWHQALLAVIFLGFAPLARLHLILLFPLAACFAVEDIFSLGSWRKINWKLLAPILAAMALCGVIILLTKDPKGGHADLALSAKLMSSLEYVLPNLVSYAVHWVLLLPLAIPLILMRPRQMIRHWLLFVVLTLSVIPVVFAAFRGFWPAIISPIAGLGAVAVWHVASDAWKKHDGVQFLLSLMILLPLPICVYLHMPGKYLLISAPAVAVIIASMLDDRTTKIQIIGMGLTVVLSILLGIAIIHADANLAGLGRQAAKELIAPNVSSGKHVWYAGHWGFHWYAEKAGAQPLSAVPPFPVRGDLLVSSKRAYGYAIDLYPRRSWIEQLTDKTAGGRIMCKELGAGFYSNSWGYLPWAWGDEPCDVYDLWIIDQDKPTWPLEKR